jgi:branched-subunit amino acid aminotransferase/4-amino-4-deoxychorismate lyase
LDSVTRRILVAAGAVNEESCPVDRLGKAEGAALVGTTVELHQVDAIHGVVRFKKEVGALQQAAGVLRECIRAELAAALTKVSAESSEARSQD